MTYIGKENSLIFLRLLEAALRMRIKNQKGKNLSNTEHLYQSVETDMGRRLLLESLVKEKEVCFDTETTSLNALHSELVGIAFSWEAGKGYYLSIPEEKEKALEILEPMKVFLKIKK